LRTTAPRAPKTPIKLKRQRGVKRPLTPPGSGAGSVASCSTSASTSDRCEGESLRKAFHSRKPCTVSLEGNPSVALTSDADVRFFIPCLLANQFHAGNTKPQVLREKYAKEDQREQVMSAVAREGTFAEVEYTRLYASLRLACRSRVDSRIRSRNRMAWTHNERTNWTYLWM